MLNAILDVVFESVSHLNPEHSRIGNSDLGALCASIHAASHIQVVVFDYAHDDVGRGNAFSSLRGFEHASFLDLLVYVVFTDAPVRQIIVSHIVDVLALEPLDVEDPRAGADDFVGPAAVLDHCYAFVLIHNNLPLLFYGLSVAGDTHNQVDVLESLLGLFKDFCVANVEHIKDTVGIYSNWVVGVIAIGHCVGSLFSVHRMHRADLYYYLLLGRSQQ